jgi:hypothetical protein
MTPRQALEVLLEDEVITIRPDGWFYIHQRPAVRDLARFVLAIKSLGAWSVETALGKAKVRITTGGIDARDGIMFKIEG